MKYIQKAIDAVSEKIGLELSGITVIELQAKRASQTSYHVQFSYVDTYDVPENFVSGEALVVYRDETATVALHRTWTGALEDRK